MPAQLFGGGAPERHRALVLGRAVEDSHDAKPGWTQRVRALRVRRAEGEHRFSERNDVSRPRCCSLQTNSPWEDKRERQLRFLATSFTPQVQLAPFVVLPLHATTHDTPKGAEALTTCTSSTLRLCSPRPRCKALRFCRPRPSPSRPWPYRRSTCRRRPCRSLG